MKKDYSGVAAAALLAAIGIGLVATCEPPSPPLARTPSALSETAVATADAAIIDGGGDPSTANPPRPSPSHPISDQPDQSPNADDAGWHIILSDGRNCGAIRLLFDADTPYEIIDDFAARGRPLSVLVDNGEMVMVRQGVGLDSTIMGFVKGRNLCITAANMSWAEAQH